MQDEYIGIFYLIKVCLNLVIVVIHGGHFFFINCKKFSETATCRFTEVRIFFFFFCKLPFYSVDYHFTSWF